MALPVHSRRWASDPPGDDEQLWWSGGWLHAYPLAVVVAAVIWLLVVPDDLHRLGDRGCSLPGAGIVAGGRGADGSHSLGAAVIELQLEDLVRPSRGRLSE